MALVRIPHASVAPSPCPSLETEGGTEGTRSGGQTHHYKNKKVVTIIINMKIQTKLFLGAFALVIALTAVAGFLFVKLSPERSYSAVATAGVFYSTGTTNASVIVNRSSTQVLPPTWSQYARISNNGTSTISCSADGQTAASSSVTSSVGIIITPITGGIHKVSFGNGSDVPYIGSVNCVATVSTTVGVIYH